MRAWGFGVAIACSVTLLASPGLAATQDVRAEFDYRLTAQIDGYPSVPTLGVLRSLAPPVGWTEAPTFDLVADHVEAVFVEVTDRRDLVEHAALRDAQVQTSDESIEYKTYDALDVNLVLADPLWNVVAYHAPLHGNDVTFGLPEGKYDLANAAQLESVLRADVPRPQELEADLAPAVDGAAGRLRLTGDALEAQVQGDFFLLLYGGTFELATPDATETIVTGRYKEVAMRDDLPIPAEFTVNASLLLKVRHGILQLANGGDAALYAPAFDVAGRILFEDASGTVEWPDATETAEDSSLAFEGEFTVAARGAAYERAGGSFGALSLTGRVAIPAGGPPTALLWSLALGGGAFLATAAAVRWVPGVRRVFFAAVAGFSMVGKDDALEHQNRSQLFEYVRSAPGASLSAVQRDLRMGWGTVEYHVSVLERLGLLVTKRAGGKRLLFVNGQSRIMDPSAWSLLQNPSVRLLVQSHLGARRAITQQEAAVALGCSPQYAGRLLKKLHAAGLVEPVDEADRRRSYRGTPVLGEVDKRVAPAAPAPLVEATIGA